jgi:hypothetical protein
MPYKDKAVDREYKRQYYSRRRKEDPNYSRKGQYDWRIKNPKKYLLSRARGRAKIEGIPFSITEDDFDIPEYCPIFRHLKLEFSSGRGTRPDNIPTLDKIVPSLGYVSGNVAVISMRANRLKSDASAQELQAILDWVNEQTSS